jgi:type III restriction enzyme
VSRFLPDLQRDLGLVYQPENWDEVRSPPGCAATCPSRRTDPCKQAGIRRRWLTELLRRDRLHAGAGQSAEVSDPQSARGAHP